MRGLLRYLTPFELFLWLFAMGVIVFLLAPLIVVIPVSFEPGTVPKFPPSGVSARWYEDLVNDQRWRDAAWLSIRLGVSVAVLSTLIGLMAAVALTRFVRFGKTLLRTLVLSPLIVPLIVSAIAMFDITLKLGLARTFWGLMIAHLVLAQPFSVVILENALRSVDVSLEDAATSLGASRLSAFRKVTLPLIGPAVVGSLLFAFITSWDEVVVVLLVGGAHHQTLPVRMFEFVSTQVRPTVAAISSLLILGLFLVIAVTQLIDMRRAWRDRRERRAAQPAGRGLDT